MSGQPTDQPSDHRRRRRPAGVTNSGPRIESVESTAESDEDLTLTRTLFSFFEPVLNLISSFSFPIVVAGVIGIVAGAIVLAFVSTMRDPYGWVVLWFSIGLIAVVALNSFSTVLAAFISRTGRYGVNTLIMTGAFTGIVLVIGVVTFENTKRIDVTATNQFSLADRTKQLLNDLDEPIRVTAFYKDASVGEDQQRISRRVKVEDTLKEFAARTSKLTFRVVDPDFKPEIAKQYFGDRPINFVAEAVVVENLETDKIDVVQPTDDRYTRLEQDLVTALLVATGEEQKVVYFLTGHGERSLNSPAADGYSQLRDGLEQDNYRVESLAWDASSTDVSVPEDAALLIIGRPTADLPEAHARALDLYLLGKRSNDEGVMVDRRESGRMIFLADVDTEISFRGFLLRWGINVEEGYIRDVRRSVPDSPQTLRLSDYNPQAPLEIIFPRGVPLQVSFMPSAAALSPLNDGLRFHVPLAVTSSESYLIKDLERTDPVTDAGDDSDTAGPFTPAVFVRGLGPVGTTRPASQPPESAFSWVVVFGDSDFVANSFYQRGGGADLFLNSANFLLGDFSLVSIREKAFPFRELNLNKNEERFVRWTSWLFLPGLLGLMAALVWWIRR